ncbi:MAG: hypothetical protein JST47_12330 [Bacteroidetes bacterium]|nr:hypothetical protein [Bacteroidota bacterium]MBS1973706.1 hypothetical protein [Bacteroidota bacterium]
MQKFIIGSGFKKVEPVLYELPGIILASFKNKSFRKYKASGKQLRACSPASTGSAFGQIR